LGDHLKISLSCLAFRRNPCVFFPPSSPRNLPVRFPPPFVHLDHLSFPHPFANQIHTSHFQWPDLSPLLPIVGCSAVPVYSTVALPPHRPLSWRAVCNPFYLVFFNFPRHLSLSHCLSTFFCIAVYNQTGHAFQVPPSP